MANTTFNNRKLRVPITVPNGGTGRTSLTDKNVIVGAGTGDVNFVAPGTSGQVLTSDGTNWTSGTASPADSSVSYTKLAGDLVNNETSSSVNVDWSANSIFTKTIDVDTIFTFSNYQLNKTITLIVTGDYALGFPFTVRKITGTYVGAKTNYITLQCVKATAPQEVLAFISQES
jgi:hypothetical protein